MIGITSYGAYVPRYRMPRMNVFMTMGWFNPVIMSVAQGEKAVANYDEDSITMAVSAALDCIKDLDREEVDALYLASTTFPYRERENASIVSAALDLRSNIRSADFGDSLKAGTTTLLAALDAVKGGSVKQALVTSADCRLGKMGSMQEMFFGDGAAAFMIGSDNVIAEFKGAYSFSRDFVDHYRSSDAKFDRTWEERWIRDEGYSRFIPESISGVLKEAGLRIEDFAKVIYPCHFNRVHGTIGKKLGVAPEKIQPNLYGEVGDTGAAHPLLMLTAALEESSPGDKLLVASYGSGSDAMVFEVTDKIKKLKERKGLKGNLAKREELASYEKYCVFRDLTPVEMGIRGETESPTAFTTLYRNRRAVLGLVGHKCKQCGTPHFPPQRICPNPDCGSVDQFEDYRFSDKPGHIFTYTGDMLAFSFDPPAVYGIVDFEGGGRTWLDFTDCKLEEIKVGQSIEMTFRRKYMDKARGVHGYFWKVVPVK
jgi:hydroxymethylglutaryl-CoA synthase